MLSRCLIFLVAMALIWPHALRAQSNDTAQGSEIEHLFENSIRPVLTNSCFTCHGDPSAKLSGGLRVDSREGLLNGGDSGSAIDLKQVEESLLLRAISRAEGVAPMPPNNDLALRPDQVAAFKRWIAAGAPWPASSARFESRQHWAFKTLPVEATHDIDYWIRLKHAQAQAGMAPRADRHTLLRRATFDLTGLPPTYEQMVEFNNDASPQAFDRLIDRLLDSPGYGEHWGRHWLDVVRYADTAGETADYPVPNAWRYRNYVIDAFNRDQPYDQFLREQIAGDILAEADPSHARYAEMVTATGYLAISRRFGFDSENYHHLTIQDTIDTLGQSFLGLSLGCARCHDHKFDPISMQDYYGLYGIFDSTRYAFPGSEQKQKVRSMMPLVPAREALVSWRKFDQHVGQLRQTLERNGQPPTAAVLRMLNDMDGDFELQAPAAGGSNGVLVPPWIAVGPVEVSNAAQSPFQHIYGSGKSGIRIPTGAAAYSVKQAIYPQRNAERDPVLQLHADFRVPASTSETAGVHRLWLGSYTGTAALCLDIARDRLLWSVPNDAAPDQDSNRDENNSIAFSPDKWQHLRVNIDLSKRQFSIEVGEPGSKQVTSELVAISKSWNGQIDLLALSSDGQSTKAVRPTLDMDNLALMEPEPVGTSPTQDASASPRGLDAASINQKLSELVGTDSDFEMQTADAPPAAPWNAGPNSVVKIMPRAQSPDASRYLDGQLGVHMPNRGEYDGFGCGLPVTWKADLDGELTGDFDFRCADAKAGGQGSWRFYIGHGPGNSAAVELFMNADQLFTRSGDARSPVGKLKIGQWYHLQVKLNLRDRKFRGELRELHQPDQGAQDQAVRDQDSKAQGEKGQASSVQWNSDFAANWDGTIDHTFIDSYGHIGGVRPALDVDNYAISAPESTRPALNSKPSGTSSLPTGVTARREMVKQLRAQQARGQEELKKASEALQRDLSKGPFDLAYAVAEGTPHDAAIQIRGEPGQLGQVVQRGFIKVLGGEALPAEATGSGRLQLAHWITAEVAQLAARVMVNRIWQFHFGRGLVMTPNDFGVRGAAPTHPELLDQLAHDFIRSGWSIKAMHRQIMSSQVYQQASVWTGSQAAQSLSRDLYVGFARRRLSAEEIRDSILSVCGLLDRQPGTEHPFAPPTTWGYTQHGPFSAVYDHDKRSVYLMTQRLKRHPFVALFDGPDPNASTAVRLGTTVPTQALYFMNDPFVHRASAHWSIALSQLSSDDERVKHAYEVALQRAPTPDELEQATSFLDDYRSALSASNIRDNVQPMAAMLRTLIGSNEFLHVD